jgi:hypothetical protein
VEGAVHRIKEGAWLIGLPPWHGRWAAARRNTAARGVCGGGSVRKEKEGGGVAGREAEARGGGRLG